MTRELHPRNKHHGRYDFDELIKSSPELNKYVITNAYDDRTIDFFDPAAVKMLNKALLKHFYGIAFWDIPENYLCPSIPGRADYIHHIADLLADDKHNGNKSRNSFFLSEGSAPAHGNEVKCLDIGVGANCIYPVIGCMEYGWTFIGSDIDPVAVESAKNIVRKNPLLKGKIEIRLQPDRTCFFKDILLGGEYVDVTICNPPFHSSPEEAREVAQKKIRNLMQNKAAELRSQNPDSMFGENPDSTFRESKIETQGQNFMSGENQDSMSGNSVSGEKKAGSKPVPNFGGQNNELWCPGGEEQFVRDMAFQSRSYASQCRWFSSLIAKKESLRGVYSALKKVGAVEVKTIPMGQGNKISRIVAWRF
ncbi:MAG: 23S rRNA (adenine(1618)-N(6))-methyltransferase RlmF [Bacteroidales bacterium]|nr:23S rRNA (adenine(1618)-N(6))-methyltransferase RlmF [Bacteroidales bacterium]